MYGYGEIIIAKPSPELTRFIWWMQTKCKTITNPQTMPTNLDCESTVRWPVKDATICIYRRYLLLLPSSKTVFHFLPSHAW